MKRMKQEVKREKKRRRAWITYFFDGGKSYNESKF